MHAVCDGEGDVCVELEQLMGNEALCGPVISKVGTSLIAFVV